MTDGGEDFNLGHVVGADGAKGDTGNGISSITKTSTSGKADTYTITFTNGTTTTFQLTNGSDGAKGDKGDKGDTGNTGNGISSITKTGTSGLVDTYTITFTNGSTTTFTVTNGSNASVDIVTSWNATTSDTKVPSEKLAKTSLDNKVDKVTGKGLSTNDFTNTYKGTLDNLSTVATSGSYNDLGNKPTIPSKTSDLNNDSGFITPSALTNYVQKSSTSGLVKNDGSIDTNTYLTPSAITGMLTTSDVANDLTTTTSGKVLDARQGKALADLIGAAITYINQ